MNHQTLELSFDSIEFQNIIQHFPELINAWCQQHCGCKNCKNNKQECDCKKCQSMCKKAVDKFGSEFSADYIRKNIDPKFKVKFRRQNGFMKKLKNLEGTLQQNLYQTKLYEEDKN